MTCYGVSARSRTSGRSERCISGKNKGIQLILETVREMSGKSFIFASSINEFHSMLKSLQEILNRLLNFGRMK